MPSNVRFKVVFISGLIATFSCAVSLSAYQLTFTPRASVSEAYTTNVFLDNRDEKDDFITILSTGFTAQWIERDSEIEISYDPAYVYYKDFDENNSWRHLASFNGKINMTQNNQLEVSNEFFQSEDPLTREEIDRIRDPDPLQPEDTTVRKRGRTFYRNATNGTLNYQFGPFDFLRTGFTYILRRDNDPDGTDSDSYNPFVNLTYWFSENDGLEAQGDYIRGDFDGDDDDESDFNDWRGTARLIRRLTERLDGFAEYTHTYRDFDGDEDDDYQVYQPAVGVRYEISADASFASRVGYFYQKVDGDDNGDGLVADGLISKIWSNASLDLAGSTGYTRADFGAENLGFEEYYRMRADVSYAFTQHLSADFFGSYRHSEFTETEDNREDDVYRVGAELSYQVLPWMSLRLGYLYNEVDSTRGEESYQEHRSIVSISVSPTTPFRYSE
jgi:hypothetical protein